MSESKSFSSRGLERLRRAHGYDTPLDAENTLYTLAGGTSTGASESTGEGPGAIAQRGDQIARRYADENGVILWAVERTWRIEDSVEPSC